MAEIEDGTATAALAEVRLDEDGQPMSKSALKKLLKKEAADKKKAEKATRVSKLVGFLICFLGQLFFFVASRVNYDNVARSMTLNMIFLCCHLMLFRRLFICPMVVHHRPG